MDKAITITTQDELEKLDRETWSHASGEERLMEVERLRQEAGKFLYETPFRFRRVLKITRRPQR